MSDDETEKLKKKKPKKKDQIWQEAGEEFFQESYPSGSGQDEPQPGKQLKRKSGASGNSRRFQHNNSTRRNNAGPGGGGNNTTNTITYAMTGRHGTFGRTVTTNVGYNTCGAGTIYDNTGVLPDLTDLSIPNEQKRWEEVQKIRTLPIPMAQKRELKTQLTTIPMLKLKGWKLLRWKQRLLCHSIVSRWKRFIANFTFWNGSIHEVAVGRGIAVAQLFQLIKWAFKLNFIMCILILTFILLPQLLILKPLLNQSASNLHSQHASSCGQPSMMDLDYTHSGTEGGERLPTPIPGATLGRRIGIPLLNRSELASCCTELYYDTKHKFQLQLQASSSSTLNSSTNSTSFSDLEQTLLLLGGHGRNEFSPLYYGFYYYQIQQFEQYNSTTIVGSSPVDNQTFSGINSLFSMPPTDLVIKFYSSSYSFIYLITQLTILFISLIFIIKQANLKSIIVETEDGGHRYSDCVFTGWEYFTKDNESAKFKRKAIRHQMKLLLKDEKYKIQLRKKTRRDHWKLFGKRILTNLILLGIHVTIGILICEEIALTNGNINNMPATIGTSEEQAFALFLNGNNTNTNNADEDPILNITIPPWPPSNDNEDLGKPELDLEEDIENIETIQDKSESFDKDGEVEAAAVPIPDNNNNADAADIGSDVIDIDENRVVQDVQFTNTNIETTGSNSESSNPPKENNSNKTGSRTSTLEFWLLIVKGFLPALTIAKISLLLPSILKYISRVEKFSQSLTLKLKVWRIIISRILCILFVGLKLHWITYCKTKEGQCTQCDAYPGKDKAVCWESLFGEHLYKIVLVDLTFKIIIGFGLNTMRNMIGLYCPGKLFKRFGTLKFNLTISSLDILYIQFLSWIGAYFAPFLPILVLIYTILLFYLNKLTVFITCRGIPNIYKTIRLYNIYLAIKLMSFALVAIILGIVFGYLEPSKSCGPFRQNAYPWTVFMATIYTKRTAPIINTIFLYLGHPVTLILILLLLLVLAYYYYTLTKYSRGIVGLLKNMLVLEGHDKQFLFARLNSLKRSSINSTNSIPLTRTHATILNEDDD